MLLFITLVNYSAIFSNKTKGQEVTKKLHPFIFCERTPLHKAIIFVLANIAIQFVQLSSGYSVLEQVYILHGGWSDK